MPDDFMDFLSEEEMREILEIEAELGVDIDLEEILSEIDDNEDDDALNWAE